MTDRSLCMKVRFGAIVTSRRFAAHFFLRKKKKESFRNQGSLLYESSSYFIFLALPSLSQELCSTPWNIFIILTLYKFNLLLLGP